MNGWRVVDCSQSRTELRSVRGQVRVTNVETGSCAVVPTADVAMMLIGPGTALGPCVLQRCCDDDVVVLVCDWRGVPVGCASGLTEHSLVGKRQLAQSSASLPRRKRAWQAIIRAKVTGQARVLSLMGSPDTGRITELIDDVRSGDPGNVEAIAARIYWSAWCNGEGMARVPGMGVDDINSCLDYGYGVLRGHAIRAVMSAGLSPVLGVFHRGRSNGFNLADDLMEPCRPVIDWVVATMGSHDLSDPAVKHQLVAAASAPFTADGATIPTYLCELAQHLGGYFENDELRRFTCSPWSAPNIPAGAGGR